MPIGGALAAAGIGSAVIGGVAATKAAKTQAGAARDAANLQLQMFNTIRGDLGPYRNFGASALPGIAALLGLPAANSNIGGGGFGAFPGFGGLVPANDTGMAMPTVGSINYGQLYKDRPDVLAEFQRSGEAQGLDPMGFADWWLKNKPAEDVYAAPTWAQADIDKLSTPMAGDGINAFLENLPGYKFVRQQGMQSIENAMSARGLGGLSGSLGKGLARFVTGLADTTYGEQLNRLMGVAGMGQNAAAQTGTFGTQAASGAGGSLIGGANAQAAGTVGAANAIGAGLQAIPNALLTSRILGMYAPPGAANTNAGGFDALAGLY